MTNDVDEPSRFQIFSDRAKSNISEYRKTLQGDGTFEYVNQLLELAQLANKMNQSLLVYLFGDLLGQHLAEKFAVECRGNLLFFLNRLTSEYRFFILHELKNNKHLFAYC